MVGAVLQYLHLRRDALEDLGRLSLSAEPHQRHPQPVARCRDRVVVGGHLHALIPRVERLLVITFEIVREREVVPDVEVQRAARLS